MVYLQEAWTALGRALETLRTVDPVVARALEYTLASATRSQRPDPTPVGVRKTVSGRELPVFDQPIVLVFESRCPRKFAIVDLEAGTVAVRRQSAETNLPGFFLATPEDMSDIAQIVSAVNNAPAERPEPAWEEAPAPAIPWL